MVNTKVTLSGITLDNPVIPASGTFGYGYEFAELYDINILGTFSFKGTTKEPRFGNPTPRIAECTAGMINSVGLQNPGVEKVISEELPKLKKCFHKPVIANVSGFSVEEYAKSPISFLAGISTIASSRGISAAAAKSLAISILKSILIPPKIPAKKGTYSYLL